MVIQSQDQLISALSNGQRWREDWNKNALPTTAQVAGQWYDLFGGAGNPPAQTVFGTGTNLVYQQLWDINPTTATGIPHGGNVGAGYGGYVKNLLNASVFSAAATTAPATFVLVDLLGFIPVTTVTTTGNQTVIYTNTFTCTASGTTTLTYTNDWATPVFCFQVSNSGGALPSAMSAGVTYYGVRQTATTCNVATSYYNALNSVWLTSTGAGSGTNTMTMVHPRYSTGAGVYTYVVPSTVMGAATPNYSQTYINAAGTTGRTTPSTPALPACNSAAPVGSIIYSGTGSGKYGPYVPLASGDTGVRMVTAVNLSATYLSGVLNVVFAKPLLTIPITTVGVAGERDLLNQMPSLPVIQDGACLAWLMYAGAATPISSAFYGSFDTVWG
jgi:hypothetical protein